MYDDQIKLKYDHGAMGRENQGEERRENQGEDQEERNQICLEPKPPQPIRPPIQTQKIFDQHSNKIRPFDHNLKTSKSG